MEPLTVATTIGTLAGTAGKIIDLVKSAKKKAPGDSAAREALDEAQDLVIALRQSILDLQEDVLRLQEENSQLRRQVSQEQERALNRSQFEVKAMGKGAAVVRKGESAPLYCPNCYDAGRMSVLTTTGMRTSSLPSHHCGVCKSPFNLR